MSSAPQRPRGSPAGGGELRLHPTRFCNLRCGHCYSSSGPEAPETLPFELVRELLRDARAEGYQRLHLSGGEPLLYPDLQAVLREARDLGMTSSLCTNGMLLTQDVLQTLEGQVALLSVSVDGRPAAHDRLRASPSAFAGMARRLPALRRSRIPFEFAFTLTRWNLEDLPWVAEFARDQGAGGLEIQPLKELGRARLELPGGAPGAGVGSAARQAIAELRTRLGSELSIRIERRGRETCSPQGPQAAAPEKSLAELVSPLVVQSDGWVAPHDYGLPHWLRLGNLHDRPLRRLAAGWKGRSQHESPPSGARPAERDREPGAPTRGQALPADRPGIALSASGARARSS